MTNPLRDAVLSVDLGKTSCRVRLSRGTEVLWEGYGKGAPGLFAANGEELAFRAIDALARNLEPTQRDAIGAIGIGSAGVEAGRDAALALAKRVATEYSAPTALINDALAAHVGAFAGGPGTILIAGTGAIAFGLDRAGQLRQVDGWGPQLGDEGGGRWIGRQGLLAALRDHDGRASFTSLTQAATALAGDLAALPQWVSASGHEARQLASFAPTVLDHAQAGDATAVDIVSRAAGLLARTASAAASDHAPLCVVGGLFTHPYFHRMLLEALPTQGLSAGEPVGSALDGAILVATDSTLPHESRVIRV